MLEFKNVSFKYDIDEEPMMTNLSFTVNDGEFVSVIGASGCGKSTLFRLINGLEKPQGGEIYVDGKIITEQKNYSSFMPQKDMLFPWRTIEKNVCIPMEIMRVPKDEQEKRCTEVLKQVGLIDYRKKYPKDLSGGMKQKLALSCALIHRPDVLFLDEPTTGVDPVSRSEFWDMLDRLKRQGITILVSTPYMDEASRCDRIALVRSGECLSIDTPVGIRTSFDRRLYAVRCASMYKLLGDLREFPDTNSCFAFGDAHHLTLRRDGEDVMRRLQEYLKGKGYADVSIERLEPSVEDCFMAL